MEVTPAPPLFPALEMDRTRRTATTIRRTGMRMTTRRIFHRVLSCRRTGGVNPSPNSGSGLPQWGHTFQSGSTGAEQLGQVAFSRAPHLGQERYCSVTGAAQLGHFRSE